MNDFFTVAGGITSGLGLMVGIWVLIRAGRAVSSAKAAETAVQNFQSEISRKVLSIDVQRAISLAGSIRRFHREEKWETAVVLYPHLTEMIYAIDASLPTNLSDTR